MKVRICLMEKGLECEYQDVFTELRSPQYLKLNPGGYVPTLVHETRVITESRIISEYLDETFESRPLQPKDPYERARMRLWTKQIDDSLHSCIYILSFVANFRAMYLAMSEQQREIAAPLDLTKRERMQDLMLHGWDSRYVVMALKRFEKLVAEMDSALEAHHWLAGQQYSLADSDYTPYLQRLVDLGLDWLWRDKSAVIDWFSRVRERPSFAGVLINWVPAEFQARNLAIGRESGPKFRSILTQSNG